MFETVYNVYFENGDVESFNTLDEATAVLNEEPTAVKVTGVEIERDDFGICIDKGEEEVLVTKEVSEDDEDVTEDDIPTDEELAELEAEAAADEFPMDESLVESIHLKNDAEREEFFRLCKEIGIYTARDLETFVKEECPNDEDVLTELRRYRAELGPDFKIREEFDQDFDDVEVSEDSYKGYDVGAMVEALGGEDEECTPGEECALDENIGTNDEEVVVDHIDAKYVNKSDAVEQGMGYRTKDTDVECNEAVSDEAARKVIENTVFSEEVATVHDMVDDSDDRRAEPATVEDSVKDLKDNTGADLKDQEGAAFSEEEPKPGNNSKAEEPNVEVLIEEVDELDLDFPEADDFRKVDVKPLTDDDVWDF